MKMECITKLVVLHSMQPDTTPAACMNFQWNLFCHSGQEIYLAYSSLVVHEAVLEYYTEQEVETLGIMFSGLFRM